MPQFAFVCFTSHSDCDCPNEGSYNQMHRLQMRTILLIALLALSFGLTAISLFVIRITVRQQIHANLEQDLDHSVKTYLNLERQRSEMLSREAALLADLPSLKSLMASQDSRTIEDAGVEFWKVSGSDFLALTDTRGRLVAHYARGPVIDHKAVDLAIGQSSESQLSEPQPIAIGDRLYEIVAQPIYFGSQADGSLLGYVAIGHAIDQRVAHEVSEAAAADVAFSLNGAVVASTLATPLEQALQPLAANAPTEPDPASSLTLGTDIRLGRAQYLAASIPLTSASNASRQGHIRLIVLKSYDLSSRFLARVNQWILGVGALSLAMGGLLAISISRRVTRPLEALVAGARAFGRGEFDRQLSEGGTAEVRELSRAFDGMRVELRRSQQELLDSVRLATIGRMASSISHDLRHYLSAMYANAEFLSLPNTTQTDREELILEVQSAVHGMTDLLDSLLIFSQTGNTISATYESIGFILERSVSLMRAHPEARGVKIAFDEIADVDAWVDAKKLGRAVFNLVLNACQAAKRGTQSAVVSLSLCETPDIITIRISDSGAGVADAVRETMFLPFVSSGKQNGVGLGLTLARHIAEEHGGSVSLEDSPTTKTVFAIVLPKSSLEALRHRSEEQSRPATVMQGSPARGDNQ